MNKKFVFLMVSVFSLLLASGCANNSSKSQNDTPTSSSSVVESNSKNENTTESPSPKISSDGGNSFSAEEHKQAVDFANKIVGYISSKDMNSLSKLVAYPIKLNIDGKNIDLKNEKEFTSIEFEKIFSSQLVKSINECTTLFSSWRGFMLGSDKYNVWFSPLEDHTISIIGINN